MKILLLGKNGQVGWELQRALFTLGEIVAPVREDLDLTDEDAIRRVIRSLKPDLIINAAAYTAVDKAEQEPELAMAVNGTAPRILAEEAALCKGAMIHYSTDYVFDGNKSSPYTEDDIPNPINVYGKTKLAGELAVREVDLPHLIFRTSWVYGLRGNNFLLTILRLAGEKQELRVVDDQVGSPTWSRMIAEVTAQVVARNSLLNKKNSGVYHLSAAGRTTWHGFARSILKGLEKTVNITSPLKAITTGEFKTAARRPGYSLLSCKKTRQHYNISVPGWDHLLNLVLQDTNQLYFYLNKYNLIFGK